MTARPCSTSSIDLAGRIAGFLLSIGLLIWLIHIADLQRIAEYLRHVSLFSFVLTVLLGYFAFPLRVVQWQLLLGRPRDLSFALGFKINCLGHLGNVIFPMRGGELLRVFLLARSTSIPFSQALVSVLLTRFQDMPAIGLVLAVFFAVVAIPPEAVERTAALLAMDVGLSERTLLAASTTLAVTTGMAVAILLGSYWAIRRFSRLTARLSSILPEFLSTRLHDALSGIANGVGAVRRHREFWAAQGISFACWAIFTLSPVPLLTAFSLDLKTAVLTALSKTAITTIAHLLPSAPGTVGTFHVFCLFSVLAVNPDMDKDAALTYVFLAHIISTLTPALPGLAYLPSAWAELSRFRQATPAGDSPVRASRR